VDWPLILSMYDELAEMNPSPVVRLNRAVAVAKVRGSAAGLAELDALRDDPKLASYYLYVAVRGHLLLDLDRREEAAACYRAALELPCSAPERRFLQRKLESC
jgi:RNA polymerase sigma-70 factor (ECF subfamily)